MLNGIARVASLMVSKCFPIRWKETHELSFWRDRIAATGAENSWYEQWFTSRVGLTAEFYRGKRGLDIGCGPLGSLEWADMAAERIGVDPLAHRYAELRHQLPPHKMRYVKASSEAIPFADAHFDVITSFNSLDHVADVSGTIREVVRLLRRGGLFILMVDVGHDTTPCEPHELNWDIVDRFSADLELLEQYRFERHAKGIYQSIELDPVRIDESDPDDRPGVLLAKFRKRSEALRGS